MPRFELTSSARPDRARVNPFTKAPLPVLRGRPAAVDFLELQLDNSTVWRLRGAVLAESGEPFYEAQWRRMKCAPGQDAEAALATLIEGARKAGFQEKAGVITEVIRAEPLILDPRKETAESFVDGLASVPWFVNVGVDSDHDASACRIRSFDEWAGPEDITGEILAERLQRWEGAVSQSPAKPDWPTLEARVQDLVTTRASWNLPFDPEEDWWHPPTACVGQASFASALVARHLLHERPIPDELIEMWTWFARGHWPAAYDESSDAERGKLIVY